MKTRVRISAVAQQDLDDMLRQLIPLSRDFARMMLDDVSKFGSMPLEELPYFAQSCDEFGAGLFVAWLDDRALVFRPATSPEAAVEIVRVIHVSRGSA